jgi:hypothetical protein
MNVNVEVTAATDNHVHECNVLECHEPAVGECNEVDSTEKCKVAIISACISLI